MAVKSANEAPAANTPLRITSQLGGLSMFHIFLYLVWYAFLIDAASKHISAIKKNTLSKKKKNKKRMIVSSQIHETYDDMIEDWLVYIHQQMRKSMMAQALEPPGLRALPQQKHRLAAMIMT